MYKEDATNYDLVDYIANSTHECAFCFNSFNIRADCVKDVYFSRSYVCPHCKEVNFI